MTARGRPVAFCLLTRRQIVEHLWSRADATDGNRWQTHPPRTPIDYLLSSAIACPYLPRMLHGKEGVNGSSPLEGLQKPLQVGGFRVLPVARLDDEGRTGSHARPLMSRPPL